MARRLQSLLFFVLIAGISLALWSWSGRGPGAGQTAVQTVARTAEPEAGASSSAHLGDGLDAAPVGSSALDTTPPAPALPRFLPPEAIDTLRLIVRNGPFPYRQDGTVFQNRERRLPQQARGYYREYTVKTPGSTDRGARRIVTGGEVGDGTPLEYHYTADHYRSFRRFEIDPAALTGEGRPR